MSGVHKGIITGLVNLLVVAIVLALRDGLRDVPSTVIFLSICGAVPAVAVGALCGWIASRLSVFRRSVLVVVPMTVIVVLGMPWLTVVGFAMLSPGPLIGSTVVPTMIASLVLEYWTRPSSAAHVPGPTPMQIGALLGAVNVVAVAMVIEIYVTHVEPRAHVAGITTSPPFRVPFAALVICVGAIPGTIVGGLAGFLAQRLRECNLLTRLAGIGSVAASGVLALASLTDTSELVIPALMPTLFAVCMLERMSRPAEIVPAARVV